MTWGRLIVACWAVLFLASVLPADSFEWTDPAGGSFEDAGNWNNISGIALPPPGAGDDALFGVASTYTVTFNNPSTKNRQAFVQRDRIVFDLNSGVYTLTGDGSNNSLLIGDAGSPAVMSLTDGTLAVGATGDNILLGFAAGSTGSLVISTDAIVGSAAVRPDLRLGNTSTSQGTLSVANGGVLFSQVSLLGAVAGSTSTASVLGANSLWDNAGDLNIADLGGGTLTVSMGGELSVGGTLLLNDPGTPGVLNIQSGGTVRTASFTRIGTLNFDDGFLVVDGGTFDNDGADFVLDGATGADLPTLQMIGGATTDILGVSTINNLHIGSTNRGAMEISDGAVVSNSMQARIAVDPGSFGSVTVDGGGTEWNSGAQIFVGNSGEGTLDITGGGVVSSTVGILGLVSGSKGIATVQGNGSQWNTSSSIIIGNSGEGTLDVTDEAVVMSGGGVIGSQLNSIGTATVDGLGTQWQSSNTITVGGNGEGTMDVTGSAVVSSTGGHIGGNPNGVGTATIDGSGSEWNISGSVTIGNQGEGTLNVTQGGVVTNTSLARIGLSPGSKGTVTVSGIDSTWESMRNITVGDAGEGVLTVADQGTVIVHDSNGDVFAGTLEVGNFNTPGILNIQSGATVRTESLTIEGILNFDDGFLIVDGGEFDNNEADFEIDGATPADLPTLQVSGGTTVATGALGVPSIGDLYVGAVNRGRMEISGGSVVSSLDGHVGDNLGSIGTVTVDGTGSEWNLSNGTFDRQLFVGDAGEGLLEITDGAHVSSGVSYLGRQAGSMGTATIDGAGSEWNSSTLNVGDSGDGTLTITGGGVVSSTTGRIGTGSGSAMATIDGSTSEWSSTNLYVGYSSEGTLDIMNEGVASSSTGYVGNLSGSVGTATISGGGSQWNSTGELHVGRAGEGTLDINGGAIVSNATGIVGTLPSGVGTVIVDGSGSEWNSSVQINIGHIGTGTLTITGGGFVSSSFAKIAAELNMSNPIDFSIGTVTVDGNGSHWNNSSDLNVGFAGQGFLTVSAGGTVQSGNATIGFAGAGEVIVTGDDSAWIANGSLSVGGTEIDPGNAGTLTVEANGTVDIDGPLTIWVSDSVLINGGTITANSTSIDAGELSITGGGSMTSDGVAHVTASSATNPLLPEATVSGSGSIWTISGPLYVAGTASGESIYSVSLIVDDNGTVEIGGLLQIWNLGDASINGAAVTAGDTIVDGDVSVAGGGSLSSTSGIVGDSADGLVTVDGNGSTWTNTGILQVGLSSAGELTIQNQGAVTVESAQLGVNSGSTGTAAVDGGGSEWNSAADMEIGVSGEGILTIQNGGLVANGDASIGANASGTGAVTVMGAGSTWSNASLSVGGNSVAAGGNGSLTIADQGLVEASGATTIWGAGVVNLEGGTLRTGELIDGGGQFNWELGTLHVTGAAGLTIGSGQFFGSLLLMNGNQSLQVDAQLAIDSGAIAFSALEFQAGSGSVAANGQLFIGGAMQSFGTGLDNNGDVVFVGSTDVQGPVANAAGAAITALGDVTFNDVVSGAGGFFGPGTFTFDGGMSPGASPAEVTLESDAAFGPSNTLFIEIGGTASGTEYDTLTIGGAATLDGLLNVSLIDEFMPSIDDSFEIITATGGVTGTFTTLADELPALESGLEWAINYGANNVVLAVVSAGIPGDYNSDGVVNAADYVRWRDADITPEGYAEWRGNFGAGAGSGANQAAVPEPSSVVFFICGLVALGRSRSLSR